MKFLTVFTFVLTLFSVAQAQSEKTESYVSCTNGSVIDLLDAHVVVDIFEDAVDFHLYEMSFQLKNEQFSAGRDPLGMYMRGTSILVHSEGEEYSDSAHGILILSEDQKSATLDLAFHEAEMFVDRLTCEPAAR